MGECELTAAQAEALLKRVATDDTFRALFQAAPAKALSVLGIPDDVIINLPAACLIPKTLASKATLDDLLKKYHEVTVNAAMGMNVPWIKMEQC